MKLYYIAITCLMLSAAWGQSFEVASVKPAPPPEGGRFSWGANRDKGFYRASNASLQQLILTAFEMPAWLVQMPAWMETERYDVNAKIPEGVPKEQFQAMLRNLLVERFQMTFHREPRDLPVYMLVVAKNGPKFKEAPPDPNPPSTAPTEQTRPAIPPSPPPNDKDGYPVVAKRKGWGSTSSGSLARVTAHAQTMAFLAGILISHLRQQVVDKTGLTGEYDFRLEFAGSAFLMPGAFAMTARGFRPRSEPADSATDPDGAGPTIFRALQDQLGLKLESGKAPVEVLVIDKAEKVPIEN